jgi:hypothetical protein
MHTKEENIELEGEMKLKLNDRQKEVVRLMQNGWDLGSYTKWDYTKQDGVLQKGSIGVGSETKKVHMTTIKSLIKRGFIIRHENKYPSINPTKYSLTKKGKEWKVKRQCYHCDEEMKVEEKLGLVTGNIVKVNLEMDEDAYGICDMLRQEIYAVSPYSSLEVIDDETIGIISPKGMQPTVNTLLENHRFVKSFKDCVVKLEVRE